MAKNDTFRLLKTMHSAIWLMCLGSHLKLITLKASFNLSIVQNFIYLRSLIVQKYKNQSKNEVIIPLREAINQRKNSNG